MPLPEPQEPTVCSFKEWIEKTMGTPEQGKWGEEFLLDSKLFAQVGFMLDTECKFIDGANEVIALAKVQNRVTTGWVMYCDYDDCTELLYKDGQPMAGFYMSTRGRLFIASGYNALTDQMYSATNETEGWIKEEETNGYKEGRRGANLAKSLLLFQNINAGEN